MQIDEGAIAAELEVGVRGRISSRLSRAQFLVLPTGRGLSSVMLVNNKVIWLRSIRFLNGCLVCFICSYLLL